MAEKMRIAVLDIAASKTGALSILEDFYNEVRKAPGDNEWIFVTGVEGLLEPAAGISIVCRKDIKSSSFRRLLFELFSGGRFVSGLRPDIVFSLENTLPSGLGRLRKVLYVHQPLGFQNVRRFSLFKGSERHLAVYQHLIAPMINHSIIKADTTIVQTEWMRQAVISRTGVQPERVVRIKPDVPDISGFMHQGEWKSNEFFFPAGNILYKNHEVIRKAVKILESEGRSGINVHFTLDAPLSREEVYAMYNKCTLLFPSYIETFGLPLAEAMQSGNPIIAADTSFAHEILADYGNAFFFDTFAPESLAALMREVLDGRITPKEPVRAAGVTNSYREIIKIITNDD